MEKPPLKKNKLKKDGRFLSLDEIFASDSEEEEFDESFFERDLMPNSKNNSDAVKKRKTPNQEGTPKKRKTSHKKEKCPEPKDSEVLEKIKSHFEDVDKFDLSFEIQSQEKSQEIHIQPDSDRDSPLLLPEDDETIAYREYQEVMVKNLRQKPLPLSLLSSQKEREIKTTAKDSFV